MTLLCSHCSTRILAIANKFGQLLTFSLEFVDYLRNKIFVFVSTGICKREVFMESMGKVSPATLATIN